MGKGEETNQTAKQAGPDLEPYRRLIETQKELVRMAKQHEEARLQYEALRDQIARELAAPANGKRTLRHRIRRVASRLFKRPRRGSAAETSLPGINNDKQPFSC